MKNGEYRLKVLELLEEFEEKIGSCPTVPLTGKGLIDRQDFIDIIHDIKTLLPDEYSQVRQLKSQESQIYESAQMEARQILEEARADERAILENAQMQERAILENARANEQQILLSAEAKARELVDQHEMVRLANEKARMIVEEAKVKAEELRAGSYEYAEEVLGKVELNLSKVIATVRGNMDELQGYK